MRVSVLGAGRWGSFLAWYVQSLGYKVTLYGREDSRGFAALREKGGNEYLELPEAIRLTSALEEALRAEVIILSVGAQGLRTLVREMAATGARRDIPYILCMKGLEQNSGQRLTQVFAEELSGAPVSIWVGPGHVQSFLRGEMNCMVMDSVDIHLRREMVKLFSGNLIRFYYGEDIVGNEIGAATKNIIGIAAGMLDGLRMSSLKGALMARAPREISRLTVALGGDSQTPYGLSHLGDYEATLFSRHSHNRAFGESVIGGEPFDKLAEGYYTLQAVMDVAARERLDLPICAGIYDVLYKNQDPLETLDNLFLRPLRREFY